MVEEKDFFKKDMTKEERDDALDKFIQACEEKGQQVPLWARMELCEEEVIPPDYDEVNDPELQKALEDIDKEFGVK